MDLSSNASTSLYRLTRAMGRSRTAFVGAAVACLALQAGVVLPLFATGPVASSSKAAVSVTGLQVDLSSSRSAWMTQSPCWRGRYATAAPVHARALTR